MKTGSIPCFLMLALGCMTSHACDGLWSRSELKLDGEQRTLENGHWIEVKNGEILLRSESEPQEWLLGTVGLTGVITDAGRARLMVSTSDAGWLGTWQVELFHLSAPRERQALAAQPIKELEALGDCDLPSFPNVAGLGFLADGIALVAQAPMSSTCRKMGELAGIELDSSGELRRILSASEVSDEWGAWFGCRPALDGASNHVSDGQTAPPR